MRRSTQPFQTTIRATESNNYPLRRRYVANTETPKSNGGCQCPDDRFQCPGGGDERGSDGIAPATLALQRDVMKPLLSDNLILADGTMACI